LSANNQRHEVYHPSLNRSILAVVDEEKLWYAKLCTGLQDFVLFDSLRSLTLPFHQASPPTIASFLCA
ncbi:TPA: hypothetical protein ACGRXY_004580, partial [Escherichia coli]